MLVTCVVRWAARANPPTPSPCIRVQRTRIGFKSAKKIVVDEDRGVLLIFDGKDQFERQLPLTQLIQIEKSMVGTNQLSLIFTSQGVPMEEEETMGSLEIQLRIVFKTEFRRDEFLDMVMRTQANLNAEFEGTVSGQRVPSLSTHETYSFMSRALPSYSNHGRNE